MNFLAVATDYDGTLAYSGKIRDSTIEALEPDPKFSSDNIRANSSFTHLGICSSQSYCRIKPKISQRTSEPVHQRLLLRRYWRSYPVQKSFA